MKHKRYGKAALVVAASAGSAFLLGAGGAQAQQTQAQMLLEEVVVTARRREESLQDLPLSIAAFNAAQMEAQGLQSIEDVGDFVPNVTLTQSDRANNTRVIIRGIGGGHPDPVEVFGAGMYVDGHYIPNSLGGYLSTMDIERVEVLRGPQGTLFGKNVTGGAVNIISAKPGPDFDSKVSLRLAEDGDQTVRGSINFPITDTVFARVGVASEQFDGFYYNRHLNMGVDTKDATTISGALRWQPNDNWTLDVNAFLVDREDGNVGNQCSDLGLPPGNAPNWGGPAQEYPNGRPNNLFAGADVAYHAACNADYAQGPFVNSSDKITFSNIEQQSLFATAQWDSDGAVGGLDNLMVKMTGSYRYNDYDYLQDRDASFLAIDAIGTQPGLFDIGQDNTTRGFEFLIEAQVNDRLEFTAGVNYFYEQAKNGDGNCRNEWVSDPDNVAVLLDANGIPILAGGSLQAANPGRFVDCTSTAGLYFEIIPFPSVGGPTRSFLNTEYVENESLGVFGHLTYSINDNWTLDAGLRWTEDDRQFWNMEFGGGSGLSGFDVPCSTGTFTPGTQTVGVASSTGTTDLCRNFRATADWDNTVGEGLFNSAQKTFDDVTPMISLTRNLTPGDTIEDGMVYFLYSEGFLTGGFNVELNANLPAATSLQVYDPEHVKNYEVGFKGTFADGRVRINADVFLMDYADKQAGVDIPNPTGAFGIDDPLGIRQNVGQVDISGIEFELRASPWDGGFVSVDLGFLDQKYGEYSYPNPTPGNDPTACGVGISVGSICDLSNVSIVDLTPDYTLNIGIEHQFNLSNGGTLTPRVNIYNSGEIEYQERRLSDPKTPCTQDAYTKVGARLTYEPAGANWRATVFGENITDQEIFEACTDSRGIWRYRHERPAYWGVEFAAYFGNN